MPEPRIATGTPPLPNELRRDLRRRGFSRRDFGRVMTLAAAAGALPWSGERALAQLSNLGARLPPGAVKLNANEFALGPTEAATRKLFEVAQRGNRYQYEETDDLVAMVAELEGVGPECVVPYPGSSLPLHHAMLAFTGPAAPLVTASPGYEAAAKGAEVVGAPVVKVPLAPGGAHDLRRMAAEAERVGAGLIYVCNPNNPTGSTSPAAEIDRLIRNKPATAVVLVDEAYLHFSEQPTAAPHVAAGRDVMVLRTFSKIYGMAGLRAGFAMAPPPLVARLKSFQAGALPATAMAAAVEMLRDAELVPARRAMARELREDLCSFFDREGFAYIPSESFKVMVDTRRPVAAVIAAMKERQIYVGRPWPEWPTHLRVSLGPPEDMAKFKSAFLQVASAVS